MASPEFLPNHAQALLVTALRVEYRAVSELLSPTVEYTSDDSFVYESASISGRGQNWQVWIVETGKGNERAALIVGTAIQLFHPELLIFVGVAGGIRDVTLGDLVVATKVYGYESRKDSGAKLFPRPDLFNASERMLNQAKAVERREGWYLPPGKRKKKAPEVHFAPIAAGEGVITSSRSAELTFIRRHYQDAIAVEMEGHGTMLAAHFSEVRAIVVRGISDLLDNKDETDAKGSQPTAARNAALFASKLLSTYAAPVVASTASVVIDWDTVRTVLHDLSRRIETDFSPDIVVTMSGPGSFAACYLLSIRSHDVPLFLAITFPRRGEESEPLTQFAETASQCGWKRLDTSKWTIFLPNVLFESPVGAKVLLLDDRVITGESQNAVSALLTAAGHEVRKAGMFCPKELGQDLDYVGRHLDGEFDMPWGGSRGRS